MNEKTNRPPLIKPVIVGVEILGALHLVFAILDVVEIETRFEDEIIGALAIGIPVFISILFWSSLIGRYFPKYKNRVFKIMLIGLMTLPIILHYALSTIAERMDILTYTYSLFELLKSLVTAGFWFGASIWLRKIFPNKPSTAENTPQDPQSTLV